MHTTRFIYHELGLPLRPQRRGVTQVGKNIVHPGPFVAVSKPAQLNRPPQIVAEPKAHQQISPIAVGAVSAVAISQQRSPQAYPPRPQRDHSITEPAHSAPGLNYDTLLSHCGTLMRAFSQYLTKNQIYCLQQSK